MTVVIRGIEYPSDQAAADALGVSRKRVQSARATDRLDFVGVGTGRPMAVKIRGVEYASAKDAAEKLGVSVDTVHWAICNGREDNCGTGQGNRSVFARGQPPRPVEIAGVKFTSIADAARKLKRSRSNIRAALAGTEAQLQRLNRDAREYADQALADGLARQAERDRAGRLQRLESFRGRELI